MPTGPHCPGCAESHRPGNVFVPCSGLGTSGILVVGESPWKDEARLGYPFAGAAGAFLDRTLRRVGLERRQLILANAVSCMPRRLGWWDRPDADAVAAFKHCVPHLDDVIEKTRPRVILTLGNTAMERVIGTTGLEERQGYVCGSPYDIPVVPTYHPSFLMQGNQKLTLCLIWAFRRAQEVAAKGWIKTTPSYCLDNWRGMASYLGIYFMEEGVREWTKPEGLSSRSLLGHTELKPAMAAQIAEVPFLSPDGITKTFFAPSGVKFKHLALDIETPKSTHLSEEVVDEKSESFTIVRASISHTPGTACSFPWQEPFITLLRLAVEATETTIMWNQNFDKPRLEAQKFKFREVHDAMWAWHFLQSDLPKGLGFVAPFYYDGEPWKHLSDAQPAYYSAVDADATLRCYLGIQKQLSEQGRWGVWLRHCADTLPILERMGKQGLLLDRTEQARFKEKLKMEYDAALARLQDEIPAIVKPVKTYKKLRPGAVEYKVPCVACDPTIVV